MNTIYFYNGKVFELRGGDHRNTVVNNFDIGSNFITFDEDGSKSYHGGLCNLKVFPATGLARISFYCLVEIFRLYIGLGKTHGKEGHQSEHSLLFAPEHK